MGACVVTFTVGGLSVLNAIAGAYSENLPLICIVGGPNSNDYGTNRILHHTIGLQDFSQELRCFQTVTCYQVCITFLICPVLCLCNTNIKGHLYDESHFSRKWFVFSKIFSSVWLENDVFWLKTFSINDDNNISKSDNILMKYLSMKD